ncbi:hypothetical protein [Labrys wisconsinensis]|jgi:hypothetical protein|uniref:Uncharacterized protein n=1 Tax=Labrys wisconsinensis TaxID=425677 RepID=A0ABU0JFR8_9HYPH|nr:hypothetical protein [Labrys wisconsinensis]MDQ0472440.1 hypothetical protein [Labrys wisconsinensis]
MQKSRKQKDPAEVKDEHALTETALDGVSGGQQVYKNEFPGGVNQMTGLRPFEPSFGPKGSISQGEVNENQTDDNLP